MSTLRDENLVPSISYGYTAGAQYQCTQTLGSLTLGGYDASRFTSNNISFPFAGDVSRDLIVIIQSITAGGLNGTKSSLELLSAPILSFIDAGVPQIWLPINVCDAFENTFGLQYDQGIELYLVNDTQHTTLLAQNASITITISASSTETIAIEFPYAAFDLELTADYPGINNTTRYFPIRRAANETQYTLGRTFLQQAYIIADYERFNFSVHPCVFSETSQQDLRAILPPSNASTSPPPSSSVSSTSSAPSSTSISPGIIAAIVLAALALIFIISFGIFIAWRRRRKHATLMPQKSSQDGAAQIAKADPNQEKIGELHEDMRVPPELEVIERAKLELHGSSVGQELTVSNQSVYELGNEEISTNKRIW